MALVEVKVPDIGDFKDVSIIELLVKVGDTIRAEQSLITVESDKASMEIPSSHAGVVRELKVGMGDAARTLGSALLKAAAPAKSGEDVSLSGAKDEQAASDNYIAASLRANGWRVEQDAKGNIVSKTPPQKAGR